MQFCIGGSIKIPTSSILSHISSAFFALHPHSPPPTMDLPTADMPPPEKEKKKRIRRGPSIAVKVKVGNNEKNKKQIPKTPKQGVETSPGALGNVVPLVSTPTPVIRVARCQKRPDGIQPKYTETPSPEKSEKQLTNQDYQSRRIAIGYFYMHTLNAPKPSEWNGKDGTVEDICKRLGLGHSQRKSVK